MREILFRGKTKDNVWYHGFIKGKSLPNFKGNKLEFTPCIIEQPYADILVIPETVGQYTGLKDKNGTKIFEGDIVKYKYINNFTEDEELEEVGREKPDKVIESIRDVKWNEKSGCFFPLPERYDCEDYWYSYGIYDFEVIGNIHDNSELLKGGRSDSE